MKINNEIKVIALLSGYIREISEGASFEETTYKTAEQIVKLIDLPVGVSLQREQLAKDILIALLQNPERYKYIAEKVESGELKQEEANLKNINKAYKIADSFLSVGANDCYKRTKRTKMKKTYNQSDIVKFGEYLLSDKRRKLIIESFIQDKESGVKQPILISDRLSQITQADIDNCFS